MTNCYTFQVIAACLTDLLTVQALTLHHKELLSKGLHCLLATSNTSNLAGIQLHKLDHLCFLNHSVFNNSYSNSVFGQRWTREGFSPMELCQYLTTTPVAQANFRLSNILESFLN